MVIRRLLRDNASALKLLGLSYILRVSPIVHPAGYLISGFCWRRIAGKTFYKTLLPILFFLLTLSSLASVNYSSSQRIYSGIVIEPNTMDPDSLARSMVFLNEILKLETNFLSITTRLLGSLTILIEAKIVHVIMKTSCSSKNKLFKIAIVLFIASSILSIIYVPLSYLVRTSVEQMLIIINALDPSDMFALRTLHEQFSSMLMSFSLFSFITIATFYSAHFMLAYLIVRHSAQNISPKERVVCSQYCL